MLFYTFKSYNGKIKTKSYLKLVIPHTIFFSFTLYYQICFKSKHLYWKKTIKAILECIHSILLQKYIRNIPKNEQDIFEISFPNFKNFTQDVDVCFQPIQKPSQSYSPKK